ncbi:Sec20-domain-containing protein, partial [Chaetomium sp. MPI-CAGE-AT-0009]
MASFESLQERLAALQETTGQLRELINRLANIQFQPGSVPLSTSDEDNVAIELSTEIGHILREEEEDLELLHEEIIDLRSGRPGSDAEHRKTRLKEGAHRLQTELKDCRTSFRKAQLSARRSLETAQKLERDLLLASYAASASASASSSTILTNRDTTPDPQAHSGATPPAGAQQQQQQQLSHEEARAQLLTPRDRRRLNNKKPGGHRSRDQDDVLTTSSDITLALQRTHALIAGEVAKSAFATQTLAESSAALAELQRSYEGLDGLLARSRDLVGTLVRAQKSDTWYLRAALRLLLATLAWLVFRRFLYGPLWWVLWLPLRTGWRVTRGVAQLGGGA